MAGASGARRIVLNRQAFDAITLAVADGAFELAKAVIEGADVPDATPLGKGLIQGGGVLAFVGKKRVGVATTGGQTSVKKPRAAKLSAFGITVIGGFGFPGRFVETGTVHMAPEPFLTPELMATLPDAEGFVKAACIKHKVIGAARAARGDVFGASRAKP
jgi:hypothetical protein